MVSIATVWFLFVVGYFWFCFVLVIRFLFPSLAGSLWLGFCFYQVSIYPSLVSCCQVSLSVTYWFSVARFLRLFGVYFPQYGHCGSVFYLPVHMYQFSSVSGFCFMRFLSL